ncbi:hypothetical protein [Peribacillus sp. Hz7]
MSTIQFARNNISLDLQPSQMSIEEFYEDPHEGVVFDKLDLSHFYTI